MTKNENGGLATKLGRIRDDLAKAAGAAQAAIDEGRATIAARRAALHDVEDAPLPRAEAETRVRGYVEAVGAEFVRRRGSSILRGQGGFGTTGRAGVRFLADDWFAFQCAGSPDVAVASLMRILDAVYARGDRAHTPGLPASARPAERARLLAEVAELESADERVTDEAIAAGLNVQHRPDVVARRAAEAAEAQRKAQSEVYQAAQQARLDALHEEVAAITD
jgi:hypothetical protein